MVETKGFGSSIGSFQRPIVNDTLFVTHGWKIKVGLRVCFRSSPAAGRQPKCQSELCVLPSVSDSFLTSPFRISKWYKFVATLWRLLPNSLTASVQLISSCFLPSPAWAPGHTISLLSKTREVSSSSPGTLLLNSRFSSESCVSARGHARTLVMSTANYL